MSFSLVLTYFLWLLFASLAAFIVPHYFCLFAAQLCFLFLSLCMISSCFSPNLSLTLLLSFVKFKSSTLALEWIHLFACFEIPPGNIYFQYSMIFISTALVPQINDSSWQIACKDWLNHLLDYGSLNLLCFQLNLCLHLQN